MGWVWEGKGGEEMGLVWEGKGGEELVGFGRKRALWCAQISDEMKEEAAACLHRYWWWKGGELACDSGKRLLGAEIKGEKWNIYNHIFRDEIFPSLLPTSLSQKVSGSLCFYWWRLISSPKNPDFVKIFRD